MLLDQNPHQVNSIAYTLNPNLYCCSLILENGQEMLISDEMVQKVCIIMLDDVYRLMTQELINKALKKPLSSL